MGPAPLLGSLTRALHHTTLHTYTDHRDDSLAQRVVPPKLGDISAHHGAVAWQLTRKIRYLCDLRWHQENRAVAQGAADLQQYQCLICRRGLGTQAHILCECPILSQVRLSNHIDFNRATRRLPAGPESILAQAVVHLLHFHQHLEERGHLWTGLWTTAHRRLLQGALAGCTLRAGRRILVDISTRAATCVTHLWSLYQEALADYSISEAALRPPEVDDPPAVTPKSPTPRTPPSPRLRGPLASSSVRTRRFRARPLRHHPGPHASEPPLQHYIGGHKTLTPATGRTWDPPHTTTIRHPRPLELPPGGGPRLNSPYRPRAKVDTL